MLLLISDGLGIRILCNFTKIFCVKIIRKINKLRFFETRDILHFSPKSLAYLPIFGIPTSIWQKNEENPRSTFHSRVIFQLIPQVKITKNSIFLITRSVTKYQLLLLNGFLISVYIFDRNYHVIHLLPKISL